MSEVKPSKQHSEPEDTNGLKEVRIPEKALFDELSGLFRSIGTIISTLKVSQESTLSERKAVVLKPKEEILEQARRIAHDLERLQASLKEEFQEAVAKPFITRFLEPKIKEALRLIQELSQESPVDAFAKSFTSHVALYSKYADEQRFLQELMFEAARATREEIQRDYKLLENQRDANEIPKDHPQLHAILTKLQELGQKKIHSTDLREFFIWKSSIDQQRDVLVNLAVILIDSIIVNRAQALVEPSELSVDLLEEERSEEWRNLSSLDHNIMAVYKQLKSLADLEHRALELFELLDDHSFFPEAFDEIQNILDVEREKLVDNNPVAFQKMYEELEDEIEDVMKGKLAQRRGELAKDEPESTDPEVFS